MRWITNIVSVPQIIYFSKPPMRWITFAFYFCRWRSFSKPPMRWITWNKWNHNWLYFSKPPMRWITEERKKKRNTSFSKPPMRWITAEGRGTSEKHISKPPMKPYYKAVYSCQPMFILNCLLVHQNIYTEHDRPWQLDHVSSSPSIHIDFSGDLVSYCYREQESNLQEILTSRGCT